MPNVWYNISILAGLATKACIGLEIACILYDIANDSSNCLSLVPRSILRPVTSEVGFRGIYLTLANVQTKSKICEPPPVLRSTIK